MKNVSPARALSPADAGEPVTSEAPAAGVTGGVPTLCKICRSPKRHLIDAALANRAYGTAVAREFGFSKSAVYRHSTTCLPARVAKANAHVEDELTTASLVEAMQDLQRKTEEQLDRAITSKNKPTDVAKLIREVRENVIALGRFIGAFAGEGAKTIDNSTQIVALQNMTVDELRALTTALRSKVGT